jgi:hypothetical protein
MTEVFTEVCKEIITRGSLEELQDEIRNRMECEGAESIAWEYVILKTYLHACLKKKKDIAEWITGQIPSLDPIQQIAIRQMIPYGRVLLHKN